jgi:hypothetical protein
MGSKKESEKVGKRVYILKGRRMRDKRHHFLHLLALKYMGYEQIKCIDPETRRWRGSSGCQDPARTLKYSVEKRSHHLLPSSVHSKVSYTVPGLTLFGQNLSHSFPHPSVKGDFQKFCRQNNHRAGSVSGTYGLNKSSYLVPMWIR